MPGGEDTGRLIVLVEKLGEELRDHATDTKQRWGRHEEVHDRHEDVHIKHEDVHVRLGKDLDNQDEKIDAKVDDIRKERAAAWYWILGLIGAIVLAVFTAIWELRGSIDSKADAASIERKADKDDVKEIRDDVKEVKKMLFRIVPPRRGDSDARDH